MSNEYRARIMENRKYYADKNGMHPVLRSRLPLSDIRHIQVTLPFSQMYQTTTMAIPLGAGPWCLLYGMP